MDLKLTGKVALVTGSSRGIGLATATAFAAEGCRLMFSARSAEHLRDTEAVLAGSGAEVAAYAADVGEPDEAAGRRSVALAMVNGRQRMVVWDSKRKVLGTSPMGFACPRPANRP
jgi:NAD(P)-dependent dehydrogenase (short-subunit alcohol dehydrogenase family)